MPPNELTYESFEQCYDLKLKNLWIVAPEEDPGPYKDPDTGEICEEWEPCWQNKLEEENKEEDPTTE